MNILEINNLSVEYYASNKTIHAVRNVSLSIKKGEAIALVGESGCGKSSLALSILKLIMPFEGKISSGQIFFNKNDLFQANEKEMRKLRGKEISIIFQDPFSSLNPVLTIREQLIETLSAHSNGSLLEKKEIIYKTLKQLHFFDAERILNSYPHQLSGGQCQRIAIAMAIINQPQILIADEPTTALDVTIQKEILDLIDILKKELSLTVIFITHNLPIAKERCKKIAVMYAGEIVEIDTTENIFINPCHPYTKGLINSVPTLHKQIQKTVMYGQPPDMSVVKNGCKFYPRCKNRIEICQKYDPQLLNINDKMVRCFIYSTMDKK